MSRSSEIAVAETPNPAVVPEPAPNHKRSSLWPVALVLITLLLIVGGPIAYVLVSWSNRIAAAPGRLATMVSQAAADAVRPRLTINEIVLDAIADAHKTSKLVVFDTTLNIDVTREDGTSSWGVYWGTNVARVAVRDAHVPYVIDLTQLGTSDFEYNSEARVVTLTVPRPKIDGNLVSIDPAKIQTLDLRGGWARFDKHDTREHAVAELRPKLITQAQTPFVRKLADDAGIETLTAFVQPLAETLARNGATVKVVYTQ
jgi:hypothetical protein